MKALAERPSQLGSQAEGALRVVLFYDTLMRRRVDLPALARASADLAECAAGVRAYPASQCLPSALPRQQTSLPPPGR
jgi:hypothetical protein